MLFCYEVPTVSGSMQLANSELTELKPWNSQDCCNSAYMDWKGDAVLSFLCLWNVHMARILRKVNNDRYVVPFCYVSLHYLMFDRLLLENEF